MKIRVIGLLILTLSFVLVKLANAQEGTGTRHDTVVNPSGRSILEAGNIGIGTTAPPAKLSVSGSYGNPAIPGTSSTGILRIGVYDDEGIDIGKMGILPYAGWIQAGYQGTTKDPLSLQPLGGGTGIGTTMPDTSSVLDVSSTTKGLLLPRMTSVQRLALSMPATGLIVYQTDGSAGLYYNSGTPGTPSWALVGNNAGQWITSGSNIYYSAGNVGIGTSSPTSKLHVVGGDANIYGLTVGQGSGASSYSTVVGYQALRNNVTGMYNLAIGYQALYSNFSAGSNTALGYKALYYDTTGSYNTATGYQAVYYNRSGAGNTGTGYRALYSNSAGTYNCAFGYSALNYNTTGKFNSAMGYLALFNNESGQSNIAIGMRALFQNTVKSNLVAIGDSAMYNNGTGATLSYQAAYNTAVGSKAMFSNTTGYDNTALGQEALYNNSTGYENTAIGVQALDSNKTGSQNTAGGKQALQYNTDGYRNTALGYQSLCANTSGYRNTAAGHSSMKSNTNGNSNTSLGSDAFYTNSTGSSNIAIGRAAMYLNTTGNSNIAIGVRALYRNTYRSNNVAIGDSALLNNGMSVINEYQAQHNTAVGSKALYGNTTGSACTALGFEAGKANTTGVSNTAIGYQALNHSQTGHYNTAIGSVALEVCKGEENTAIGYGALGSDSTGNYNTACGKNALYGNLEGSYNTAIGGNAGYDYDRCDYATFLGIQTGFTGEGLTNITSVGYDASCHQSNQVVIGNTSVTSIGGYDNWTDFSSDKNFSSNVSKNVPGLDFILKLNPVTYHADIPRLSAFLEEGGELEKNEKISQPFLSEIIQKGRKEKSLISYSGFMAQDVAEAARTTGYEFSGVVAPANEHGVYGLRYSEFVVPLVKAVQEQQEMIEDQKAVITGLQKQIDQLTQRISEMDKR